MNNCYKIKTKYNQEGLFDKSIDATYIIYLEGNTKRLQSIEHQLSNIIPTKTIHILVNKGWKKCVKSKYITNTAKDLVDCNINCFKHAKKNNYNNILILEDDFIFDEISAKDINNIDNFLINNIDNKISFYFGTIPFIFLPYSRYINRGILNIYTHSVVFTKKLRDDILKYNYENIYCWDMFQNYFNNNKYYYYKPLCYQIVEITENSKNWPVFSVIKTLWFKLAYILKADGEPKLLFQFVYFISYIITLLLIIILIYVLKKIIQIIY